MSESAGGAWRTRLDRFEILRTLGSGGMGVVYEAVDRTRDLRVALKTLPQTDAQALYRFKQEFRLLAGITHPNLAALHELIAADDQWFLTMELVEGTDFLTHLREGPPAAGVIPLPLSPGIDSDAETVATGGAEGRGEAPAADLLLGPVSGPAVADLGRLRPALRQLVSALIALHAHRRLHCDIKPSNVLVTREGRVVVLDFGLATEFGRSPGQRLDELVYGTAAYMAPEQATGGSLSPACDWYAVGSMLYEVLTGRRPFGGAPHEIILAKQRYVPPAPHRLNPRVPESLSELCLRLMSPSPATRATGLEVLEAIGAPLIPVAVAANRGAAALVGREPHLAVLRDAFGRVVEGGAACVFVHAPSGVGKSALVEHFSAECVARHGALVVSGRCYEQESVQYKALDSLVDALSRHLAALPADDLARVLPSDAPLLARMFPVLQRLQAVATAPRDGLDISSQQELRDRGTGALRLLLRGLSARQPLVVAIDDLQWGDADSAVIILGILAGSSPPPLLLICAYRREHAASSGSLRMLLDGVSEAVLHVDLPVDTLEPADAERLATRLLGGDAALAEPMAARIAQESGGNPYFVQALVEYVRAEAQFSSEEALAEGISLDEVLRRRVSRLKPAARRLLEAIAVAGRPLREADAYAAAALDSRDPGLLSLLRNTHLIRGGGDDETLETYHDRIRESVVEQLPAASLQQLHRGLAVALEAHGGADPEWLGAHFQGAGERPTAARYYAQAADVAASTLAFDRAAELYRRSIDMGPGDRWTQQSLRVRLADALANGGRSVAAAEAYRSAAREAAGTDALELERKAGYQLCIGGSVQAGRALLATNLNRVGINLPGSPGRAISSLLLNRARLRWMELSGRLQPSAVERQPARETLERLDLLWAAAASLADVDVLVAAALQARHIVEAIRAQEPGRIAAALALQVMSSAHEGVRQRGRTVRLLDTAQRFADRVATPYARAMTLLAQATVDTYVHRWKSASDALDQSEDLLRRHCTGVIWELSMLHGSRVSLLRWQGEYAAMTRMAESVLAEARQRGDVFTQARLGILVGPDTHFSNDDPVAARATARRMRREWLRRDFPVQRMLSCFSELEADIYTGRGWAAWRRVERYRPALERSRFLRLELVRILALWMRAGSALAAVEERPTDAPMLLAAAERAARALDRERNQRGPATAQATRAAIAWHRGDRRQAADLLRSAASWFEREKLAAFHASATRYLGLITGGAEGRRMVASADAWFLSQGLRNPARSAAVHIIGFPRSLEKETS